MTIDEWVGEGIPDEVSEQAARWIAILDSDDIDPLEWKRFSEWLEKDPINRWAFEELSEVWARLETLGDSRHLLEESQVLDFPTAPKISEKSDSTSIQWQSVLAIILISIGLLTPFLGQIL